MAQRELGQPLRADGVACLSSFTTAWRAPRGSGSPSHRRQRATGSDATVPVPTGGASLAARTFEMNDERAVSQARPTYPGGRGDLPESPKSPRPYSEITGRQGCRPFDARSFGRVTRTRGCPTATQTTGRTRGTRAWRRDAGRSCPTNTTSKQQDRCRQPAALRSGARRDDEHSG